MLMKLEVEKGPERGKVFTIEEPGTYLGGRSPKAKLRFSQADPYISRRHFLLEVAPPNAYFHDLEVTNPSRVNEMYVNETELHDGDLIEVGYTTLRVRQNLQPAEKTVQCRSCGKALQVIEGEEGEAFCADCLERMKSPAEPSRPEPRSIMCYQCGRDLRKQADKDGRADELGLKPVYCCSKCLPEKGGDAGIKIGAYDVVRKLGEGGFGKVYLGYQKSSARLVAIKQLNIHNAQLTARFEREIQVMRKIFHPNVVSYIDSGVEKKKGRPYLVMEYAPGGNLGDLMQQKGGTLPFEQAVGHIIKALEGLHHIHGQGIIHRDLKPENILLRSNWNGELESKIADFGLAKSFENAGQSNLTKPFTAMGTILYMSPEQIEDARNVKEPADLYSMGATLYHLVTGKYPFDFPTPADLIRMVKEGEVTGAPMDNLLRILMQRNRIKKPQLIVLEDDPIPVLERNRNLPEALSRVIDKSINKQVSKRYQRARAFQSDLKNVLASL